LTEAGYAALAPDIFWRVQPGIELGYTADDIAKGRELKAKMNMDEVIEDVRAAFDVLGAQPECQGQKLGIIGFCYGGLISYTAATRLDPACASSYYGGGIVEYLNEADRLSCPIQFHFGEQDAAIPLDQVEQVRKAVSRKTNAEVFVYEGAGHGFHCDQRGSYNEASAKIAWERTLSLFGKYLA
jgi:carboxymethylenebutenolidase